ncbi:hypothetical protein HDU96_002955, partial [Phlyctochytrium bullatum]
MTGRGIVFTSRGSPKHLRFLSFAIRSLRATGCFLPIEVWVFSNDLTDKETSEILSWGLPGQPVSVRHGDHPENPLPLKREGDEKSGFFLKISAAVNNGFEEVIMLDSDVMAVGNPEMVFESQEYKEAGTVFWPDYWKTQKENPVWEWMNVPCVDEFEQESGMLIYSKSRAWRALLLNWHLNHSRAARDFHSFLYGDKDLFRFAWRAANVPSRFIQHWITPAGFFYPIDVGSKEAEGVEGGEDLSLLPPAAATTSNSKHPADVTADGKMLRFCGVTMVQHAPDGTPLFFHNNLVKHLGRADFTRDAPPVRYFKRFRPVYNLTLASSPTTPFNAKGWEPPAVLPPPPTGAAGLGTVPPFVGARGIKIRISSGRFACVDVVPSWKEDGTVPKRVAEVVE